MAQIVDAPFDWQFTVGVEVANDFGISEISMPVSVRVTPEMVDGTTITIPWIQIDQALSMRRVLKHLNDNTTHYTQAILRSGNSPLVRMMLAKLKFSAQRFGRGLADVPLADLVDPEPVAVNGLSLVFSLPSAAAKPITSETAEELVPVATGGVFAEAVQGRANSAEVIDLSRFWNWQDSPIPILPPDIAPVALGSRAQAIDLRAGSFDPSSLDLQQAPALPAAAGTSAAFGALQAQIFRDMSGLAAAAQVAQTSLQAASTSADSAGGQASENLRAGIEQTTDIIEKVADITSNFGTLLATTGFGAAGGGGGQTGGLGGLASSVGSQTSGRGAPATGTATELGGVLNRARALDQAATGATGSLSLDPTSNPVLGAAGSQPSGSLSLNPNSNPVLSRGTSQPSGSLALNPGSNPVSGLERAVLGQAAGLPVGAATQPSDETPDLPQIPPLSTILPALDAAGSSDENFRTGVQAGLRHLADLQLLGESDNEAQVIVTSKLRNAFRERVQFHVDAVNRGDESSLGPLLELAVLNQQAPDIADLDQFEIVSLLNLQISFVDVQHPAVVRGGENITVTGRVVQNGPGAFNGPAAQTAVTLLGSPSETGRAEGRTDDQGRFSLTIPHAAAPADGPDRFVAQNDMNLTLEAFSALSPLISDTRSFVIPGELEIVVEAATFVDDETNAFFVNGRIDAQSGRTIRIDYRITVGGRPAGGRQISDADLALTGVGGNITTVSTATDGDGRIGVLYDPDGADSANGRLTLTLGEPASRKSVFVTIQLR